MFIASNKAFRVKVNGKKVDIPKGVVGDIPDDVSKEWLIQAAIKDGSIQMLVSAKDRDIEKAIKESEKKSIENQKAKEKEKEKEKEKK